jgi:hypothetical protein
MRLHNVVAMMGPAPKRVECRSCHKQHNYKANPPGVKAPRAAKTGTGPVTRASAAKAASAAATAAASNQLDSLIAARAGVPARDYKPSERYTAGELVKHASFGIGAVLTTPSPGKIEVQFHDAKRLLLHERAMAAQAVPSRLPPPVRRDDLPRGPSDTPPKHKLPF